MIHVRHFSHHLGVLDLILGIADGEVMLNHSVIADDEFDRFAMPQVIVLRLEYEAYRITHRYLYLAVGRSLAGFTDIKFFSVMTVFVGVAGDGKRR